MKKYEKPSMEVLAVEAMNQILDDSYDNLGIYGDGGDLNNQGAPRRKIYIEDDYEDDEIDLGW